MSFRNGPDNDPFSLKSLGDALRPDQAIQETAEKILRGASVDGALRWVHIGNGMDRVNDMLSELAEETRGETRLRLLMAQRAVLDSIEQFDSERNAH